MLEIKLLKTSDEKLVLRKQTDLELKIEFFYEDAIAHRSYLAAILDGKIVGLVAFVDSSLWHPSAIGVSFVSTHGDFRRQGIASQLVTALFKLATGTHQAISMTPYESEGLLYLKPIVHRTASLYPAVCLHERE
jgi:ribosomal protein S18 acetylase RimI-like enzyme